MEDEKREGRYRKEEDLQASNYESWLKTEFEQNFEQLRDRDSKIQEVTKFYVTVVLGVGAAIIALMELKNIQYPFFLAGLLLLATCIAGEIFIVWLTALRKYFVICARQINAIRRFYVKQLPPKHRDCIFQPTDPSFTPMLRISSSHMVVMGIMTFINGILALLGIYGITSGIESVSCSLRIVLAVLAFVLVCGINLYYIFKKLKEGDGKSE